MRRGQGPLLALLLALPLLGLPLADGQSNLASEPIRATYTPHVTTYTVDARGGEEPYNFSWALKQGCGSFQQSGASARWDHSDAAGCGHRIGFFHGGTIDLLITDQAGTQVSCRYDGATDASGSGPPCSRLASDPPVAEPTAPAANGSTTVRNGPPQVTILEPTDGQVYRDTNITLRWDASDPDDGIYRESVRIEHLDTDTQIDLVTMPDPTQEELALDPSQLPSFGAYRVTVLVYDHALQDARDEASFVFRVGSAPPDPPIATTTQGCEIDYEGQMQASQGAWQDDTGFEDRPGMQLSRIHAAALRAEMPLVADRDTLVFGVRQPAKEDDLGETSRHGVWLRGTTDASVGVPVFVRFSIEQDGVRRTLYDAPVADRVPLDGPCKEKPAFFHVRVHASEGILPTPFRLQPGNYRLSAELHRTDTGAATGIQTAVVGEVVQTRGLRIFFVPILTSGATAASGEWQDVVYDSERFTVETARHFAEYMPVPSGITETFSVGILNYTWLSEATVSRGALGLEAGKIDMDAFESLQQHEVTIAIRRALLEDSWSLGAMLAQADRVMVVMAEPDYKTFVRPDVLPSGGVASVTKVALLTRNMSHWVVGHEATHTLPHFVFSEPNMVAQCGKDYHNKGGTLGSGARITWDQRLAPAIMSDALAYMSGGTHRDSPGHVWTEQCTWAHLTRGLQANIDPPVLTLRAIVVNAGGHEDGALLPVYAIDGIVDLEAGGNGSWAFALVDAAGAELARYPFEPTFSSSEGDALPAQAFLGRVAQDPRAAKVELWGPQGKLDERDLLAAAPTVALEPVFAPAAPGNVTLRWNASEGALTSVLVSRDEGATWIPYVVETTAHEAAIAAREGATKVRVVSTLGGRTSESTAEFVMTTPRSGSSADNGGSATAAKEGTPAPAWLPVAALAAALVLWGRSRRAS